MIAFDEESRARLVGSIILERYPIGWQELEWSQPYCLAVWYIKWPCLA